MAHKTGDLAAKKEQQPTRRDFIYISTVAAGVVGAAALAWPFIDQMNPDASVRALATVEVDVSKIAEGQLIVVQWRGVPVFIRLRTPAEIEDIKAAGMDDLLDRQARNDNLQPDARATLVNRSITSNDKWLVMIGICTHLGCVPIARDGGMDGWHCPCHGSLYDGAGRVVKGPAPENLRIPKCDFVSDGVIKIG